MQYKFFQLGKTYKNQYREKTLSVIDYDYLVQLSKDATENNKRGQNTLSIMQGYVSTITEMRSFIF